MIDNVNPNIIGNIRHSIMHRSIQAKKQPNAKMSPMITIIEYVNIGMRGIKDL